MTDLEAFLALHERLGVKVVDDGVWPKIVDQFPHTVAMSVKGTIGYNMESTYFFDAAGKFVVMGTWE